MVANGLQFSFETIDAQGLQGVGLIISEYTEQAWLIPVREAWRDIILNQHTWFIDARGGRDAEITAEIVLYRITSDLTGPVSLPGGRIVGVEVPNTRVTATSLGGLLSQSVWAFDDEVKLEGGSYMWGIRLVINPGKGFVSKMMYSVPDIHTQYYVPKYDYALSTVLLPTHINLASMSYNTTEWIHISAEYQ